VSSNEEIVIKDSCILFDLVDLGILKEFFLLDLTVFTTPQVMEEITNEVQLTAITEYVVNRKLNIDEFGSLDSIQAIISDNPGLSFTDGSVIELAIRKSAVILSSDKTLRNESQRKGLIVRGILWIIEELHTKNIVTEKLAIEKLEMYPEINNRAPRKEIEELLKKFRK
jgi:predicted nucleic acid-binding protein